MCMQKLSGVVLNPGFAYGRVHILKHEMFMEGSVIGSNDQKAILKDAIDFASARLNEQIQTATLFYNDRISVIFEAHLLMISDPLLLDKTYRFIEEGKSAYQAYKLASDEVILLFNQLENEYMKQRIVDIEDATSRVLFAILEKSYEVCIEFEDAKIILMDQMKPSIVFNYSRNNVLGFIAAKGSYNQHAAVIARTKDLVSMIIPSIMDLNIKNGDLVFINGYTGFAYINPSPDFVNKQLEERR